MRDVSSVERRRMAFTEKRDMLGAMFTGQGLAGAEFDTVPVFYCNVIVYVLVQTRVKCKVSTLAHARASAEPPNRQSLH